MKHTASEQLLKAIQEIIAAEDRIYNLPRREQKKVIAELRDIREGINDLPDYRVDEWEPPLNALDFIDPALAHLEG